MAFGIEALLEQGQLGLDLWRSLMRQKGIIRAPTRDTFVMIPSTSALKKPEDWRFEFELLREEVKGKNPRWVEAISPQ